VSDADNPNDDDFVAASSTLNDGLKNCRAVVSGYRALLATKGNSIPKVNEEDPGGSDGDD
jgi:hypothetical protein